MDFMHFHMIINHVPIVSTMIALGVLLASLVVHQTGWQKAALWLYIFSGLASIPVFLTGDKADHIADTAIKTVNMERYLHLHQQVAFYALVGSIVLAIVAAILLWRLRKHHGGFGLSLTLLILSFAQSVLFGMTADLGGQIAHTEIRRDRLSQQVTAFAEQIAPPERRHMESDPAHEKTPKSATETEHQTASHPLDTSD